MKHHGTAMEITHGYKLPHGDYKLNKQKNYDF